MRILSVNVGSSRPVTVKGRTVQTGIFKQPATVPVTVSRLGLMNDVLIEERKMGLEHHAVYAYPYEHYSYWQHELGREPFPLGQFGENLTVTGLLEDEVRIGDIFRFGGTVLQIAQPRIPCGKLNARMGLRFAPMFLASRRVGYYLRVLEEGQVAQNDDIELLERDDNSPTMEAFVRVTQYESWDVLALEKLLQARDLMPAWCEIIESKLQRARAARGWHGLREFRLVKRERESDTSVSLYLECARGRPQAPYHGGQQLMVVVSDRDSSGSQMRQHFYLSGNPRDLSTYRITVCTNNRGDAAGDTVPSHLATMDIGDSVMCNAPFAEVQSAPELNIEERTPILISQGIGVGPMLSQLYELEEFKTGAILFHEPEANEPRGLLDEVDQLLARNPKFRKIGASSINARDVIERVPAGLRDIHVAGPRKFVERIMNEFMALNISPAALIMHNMD